MAELKTKSIDSLTEKMQDVEEGSFRYHVLETAKNFKASWIELGQALYAVWKDKMYKEWGFSTFDAYTAREIGIRKQTAIKLLRSYYFLEKEEPGYLKKEYLQTQDTALVPTYESIDVLRLAKNKKALDADDYRDLKKAIFEKGRDAREVRKELTALIRQRQELDPEEARQKRKEATLRRMVGVLRSLKKEAETARLLPSGILKEISSLITKLESEIQ